LALYGTEDRHDYIRLLTAIELVTHHDDYESPAGVLSSLPVAAVMTYQQPAKTLNSHDLGFTVNWVLRFKMYITLFQ